MLVIMSSGLKMPDFFGAQSIYIYGSFPSLSVSLFRYLLIGLLKPPGAILIPCPLRERAGPVHCTEMVREEYRLLRSAHVGIRDSSGFASPVQMAAAAAAAKPYSPVRSTLAREAGEKFFSRLRGK